MMRLMLVPGLLAIAACAADSGGGATAAAAPGCFTLDAVTAYSRADFDTVYVQTGAGAYRLELAGACGDMAWTDAIQRSRAGSGRVCPGGNSAGGNQYNATRCQVTRVSTADAPGQMTPMP